MLVYLDSMIVQYCAEYADFVFGRITGDCRPCPVSEGRLKRELEAIRELVLLEQMGNWTYAATPSLVTELRAGNPGTRRLEFCAALEESFRESGWEDAFPLAEDSLAEVEASLRYSGLRDMDRLHVAEAIVLRASWFLTNDSEIVRKCGRQQLPVRVARVSECLEGISEGLFLR